MSLGIESLLQSAPRDVISAIKSASDKTGVDFDYLVNQAATESSFRPDIEAKTSSATGLYQFIDQTWMATVAKHGHEHGLGKEAAMIKQDFQGRYYITDDAAKNHIMDLRKDPAVASVMAAEFASDNKSYVEASTGKDANTTDLYMAHFLGAGGASKFIKAMQETPYRPAAHLMPAAARANKHVFYHSDGSPKSMAQIYESFEKKFGESSDIQTAQNATKENTPAMVKGAENSIGYRRDVSFERMYGNGVQEFVSALPRMDGLKGNLFENIYADKLSNFKNTAVNHQSLFLTLSMLDVPK